MNQGNGLEDAISNERLALAHVRTQSDEVINTTKLTSHMLRKTYSANPRCGSRIAHAGFTGELWVQARPPASADLVFDVRFLPNPIIFLSCVQ